MIISKQISCIVNILAAFIIVNFTYISHAQPSTSNKVIENEVSDIVQKDSVNLKQFIETDFAKIIILNKITAKSVIENLKINQATTFGNLSIILKKCVHNTDPFHLNNSMLISIDDIRFENKNLFQGWIFSSNPSISTFEHSVYEIIALECIKQ
ncbi:MAG: DUF2155 domain-containing protein [Rickettsiales bacterium]|nr:MAG: DUF2155 domain-containing protein [Rickettsiales bacterium]